MYHIIEEEHSKQPFILTKREIGHIIISWLAITFAFSWKGFDFKSMLMIMPIILVGTMTGFIFHELAHKYVANRYGAYAQFQMWPVGLIFAVVMSLLTFGKFVFAAPGAVYIGGKYLTNKQNGIISLAGPLANLIIAVIFIISGLIISSSFAKTILFGGAYINSFLGLFNMIPIPPLDGSKVFIWDKVIWTIFTLIFVFIVFFVY